MIGKRSKFEDNAKIQNKLNKDNTTNKRGEREGKNTESDTEISENSRLPTNSDSNNRNILQSTRRQIEECEENEEEKEETGTIYRIPKSKDKLKELLEMEKEFEEEDKIEKEEKIDIKIFSNNSLQSDTDLLWNEICNGVSGKNSGIPMGFNRLNKYLGLRKSIYTTIGASAGCGKTSLVDCAYVLNPYDWYIKNKNTSKVKFEVIYFSMERKKTYKLAKWLCMKIWTEEGILITTDQLLSWQTTLNKKTQEMAKFYIDNYFKEMTESGIVTILDGQQNPTGIYKYLYDHGRKNGREDQISKYEKRYTPNDDNLITNVIHDHAGKTKNENIGGKIDKKLSIDKASEYYCWARDYLGYSPIMINQFNRTSYGDIQYSKKEGGDPDPTVEYWKDSGNVIEDCDVAISLFNPYKYNLEEYMGYQVNDFTDGDGNNKFRGLKIIKNSYGTDNIRIGLGFLGEVSLFKEITKAKDLTQKETNSIINNQFFK